MWGIHCHALIGLSQWGITYNRVTPSRLPREFFFFLNATSVCVGGNIRRYFATLSTSKITVFVLEVVSRIPCLLSPVHFAEFVWFSPPQPRQPYPIHTWFTSWPLGKGRRSSQANQNAHVIVIAWTKYATHPRHTSSSDRPKKLVRPVLHNYWSSDLADRHCWVSSIVALIVVLCKICEKSAVRSQPNGWTSSAAYQQRFSYGQPGRRKSTTRRKLLISKGRQTNTLHHPPTLKFDLTSLCKLSKLNLPKRQQKVKTVISAERFLQAATEVGSCQ